MIFCLILPFSGGQQRRTSFAIALLQEPELLVLDEPTVGVDPLLRHKIWEHLLAISRTHVTIIITTHYVEEARQAHKVIINERCTNFKFMHSENVCYLNWTSNLFYTIIQIPFWVNMLFVSGFPRVLENLVNNKFIFQFLEMSWNFTKSGNVLEKILSVKINPLRTKKCMNIYYACRRKLWLYKKKWLIVDSLQLASVINCFTASGEQGLQCEQWFFVIFANHLEVVNSAWQSSIIT